MTARPTNVIALVDDQLHHHIDGMMNDRDTAFELHQWYINKGRNKPEVSHHLVGHLINEVFRLKAQLKDDS